MGEWAAYKANETNQISLRLLNDQDARDLAATVQREFADIVSMIVISIEPWHRANASRVGIELAWRLGMEAWHGGLEAWHGGLA